MKSVSISYNPYKLKTHITVDGKELAENSELRERSAEGNRLQEWVEDLPDMLLNEFNDNKFAVSFHGTIMDYEDLKEVLDEAQEQHKFWYYLKWEKAQEAADKEKLIDEVFREIQNGPFEEDVYKRQPEGEEPSFSLPSGSWKKRRISRRMPLS